MTGLIFSIAVPGILVLLFGAALLWVAARRYRGLSGVGKETEEKATETAFIINAFHEVTKQLKEKEKELERLKALAEQRAENVESYNENILRCVTSGVMTFDRDRLLTTINRAAEEILGIEREQALGKSCRALLGENDIMSALQDTLERKAPSARTEALLERPSGKLWLGFNTAVLLDRQNSVLGVILSFSDLTEVKRLQEQVELRERLTALGEMSAGIAHEIRNPMAVISGYLNLLSKKASKEHQAIIKNIGAEISGMNRIIGDLLTFARPASLNRVKVNLKEMIEGCVASAMQASGEGSRITTVVDLETIEAVVDETLMRQAFTNLVQNAVESMPDGGTLTIQAKILKKEFSVAIRDTGTGISRDTLKKIFLPFFTTKDKGVGMGLALAHKVITTHGGRIEVESREGKGTAFTVTLPLR